MMEASEVMSRGFGGGGESIILNSASTNTFSDQPSVEFDLTQYIANASLNPLLRLHNTENQALLNNSASVVLRTASACPIVDLTDWPQTLAHVLNLKRLNKRLDELTTLPQNWDGNGAEPISRKTLSSALNVGSLLLLQTELPEVIPNPGDTVTFEWESHIGSALLEIGYSTYSFFLKTRNRRRATDTGILPSVVDINNLGSLIQRALFEQY